jgi:hypothetical protein
MVVTATQAMCFLVWSSSLRFTPAAIEFTTCSLVLSFHSALTRVSSALPRADAALAFLRCYSDLCKPFRSAPAPFWRPLNDPAAETLLYSFHHPQLSKTPTRPGPIDKMGSSIPQPLGPIQRFASLSFLLSFLPVPFSTDLHFIQHISSKPSCFSATSKARPL